MHKFELSIISALGSGISQWLSMVGVVVTGLYLTLQGQIALPQIMLVTGMAGSVTWMLTSLSGNLKNLQTQIAGAGRAYALIDQLGEERRQEASLAGGDSNAPLLSVEHVRFNYDLDHAVLEDVSFTVNAGQTLALVGESGSGKSTLLRLLMDLYEPQGGTMAVRRVYIIQIYRWINGGDCLPMCPRTARSLTEQWPITLP